MLKHAMKLIEKIFEHRIRQQIEIDDLQFGLLKGKGSTDAIFMDRCRRILELNVRSSILFLWIWRSDKLGNA